MPPPPPQPRPRSILVALAVLLAATLASTASGERRRSPNPPTTLPTQSGTPRPTTAELDRWDIWTRQAARQTGFDWLLAKAVRIKESFNDPRYVSTTGAVGLTQLMPPSTRSKIHGGRLHITAAYRNYRRARRSKGHRFGGKTSRQWGRTYQAELLALAKTLNSSTLAKRDIRFDPRWNIRRGVAHLARDWRRFVRLYPRARQAPLRRMTLAAYYAGPGRVGFRGGKARIPSYTQAYVRDVLAVYRRLLRGLPGR